MRQKQCRFIGHQFCFFIAQFTERPPNSYSGGIGSLIADFDISPISMCSSEDDPPRRLTLAATFRGASEVEKEVVGNKNTEGIDEPSAEAKEGESAFSS